MQTFSAKITFIQKSVFPRLYLLLLAVQWVLENPLFLSLSFGNERCSFLQFRLDVFWLGLMARDISWHNKNLWKLKTFHVHIYWYSKLVLLCKSEKEPFFFRFDEHILLITIDYWKVLMVVSKSWHNDSHSVDNAGSGI